MEHKPVLTIFLGHKVIDLSHRILSDSPTWPGGCGFKLENLTQYGDALFCVQQMQHACGLGTHIDAPAHLFPEGNTIDELPLDALMAPLVIIDVTQQVQARPNYGLTISDVKQNIAQYGEIPKGSYVFLRSGWSKRFSRAEEYRNLVAPDQMAFPYYTYAAAEFLMAQGISGLGIDTLSPDGGMLTGDFPVHHLLLGEGKVIVENLNLMGSVPERGAYVQLLPVRFSGATEASVRPLAFLPTKHRD